MNRTHINFILGMSFAAQTALAQEIINTPPSLLPGIIVRDESRGSPYNAKELSLPKMTGPLKDTPQSATVVPQKLMEDQGATTLRGALNNVSGISMAAGEGGAQGDNLTLRAFSARSDLYLDGMRDFGFYYRDPFNLSEVEVLKGPSSMTFGRGSTGGAINQVSKQPQAGDFSHGTLAFGSDFTRRGTADVNHGLSEHAGFRLNVMGHESEVAGRDVARYSRFGLAPTLAWSPSASLRTTLSYVHQSENNIPDYGIPMLFDKPAPVKRENYYGFKDSNYARTSADIATFTALRESGGVVWREQFRYANYERDFQTTAPRIAGGPTPGTPLDSINVNRSQVAIQSDEQILSNDLSLTADFTTGPVRHVLIAGAEVTREDSAPVRRTFTGVPTTPLLTPDPNDAFSGTGTVSSRVKSRVATIAGYVTDTLKFGRFWDVIAGFRWDSVHAGYEQTAGTTFTGRNHNDEIPSWRGGLVYRPADTTSLYLSYATSFNPSAEQLSLSAANANLDPEKNASYEIGGKWSAPDGDLMVSAAVFRTEKTNARVPDPNDPALNVLQGRQRADGVEIGASGRLSARWQIFGGYTYMDAKLRESTTASEIGARLANAPEHSGSLWASYSVSDRWQAGLGVTAISERAATTAPDAGTGRVRKAEGYSRVDAMAKYSFSKAASLQLNVANLTDAEYIDGLYPAHVIPGAGRSFLLTGTMEF